MKILLVKMLTNDDGTAYPKEEQFWHLAVRIDGTPRTFCSGEALGYGESSAQFISKEAERGITCPKCREFIKFIKAVKL